MLFRLLLLSGSSDSCRAFGSVSANGLSVHEQDYSWAKTYWLAKPGKVTKHDKSSFFSQFKRLKLKIECQRLVLQIYWQCFLILINKYPITRNVLDPCLTIQGYRGTHRSDVKSGEVEIDCSTVMDINSRYTLVNMFVNILTSLMICIPCLKSIGPEMKVWC